LDSAGVSEADVKKRLLSMFEAHEYVLVTNMTRRREKEGEREGGMLRDARVVSFFRGTYSDGHCVWVTAI
jgi:hypothetical protein